jgi:hypothetical protein
MAEIKKVNVNGVEYDIGGAGIPYYESKYECGEVYNALMAYKDNNRTNTTFYLDAVFLVRIYLDPENSDIVRNIRITDILNGLECYYVGGVIDLNSLPPNDYLESNTNFYETLQRKLTAGEGITIDENNIIRASGGAGSIDFTSVNITDATYTIESKKSLSIEPGLYYIRVGAYRAYTKTYCFVKTKYMQYFTLSYQSMPGGDTITEEAYFSIDSDNNNLISVRNTTNVSIELCRLI